MTANFKEETIQLMGETSPYVFIPDEVIIKDENTITTEIQNCDFQYENFTNLIKVLSSFGSLNISRIINNNTTEKNYFLGEKLRIRKLSELEPKNILITCNSNVVPKRKATSVLIVQDLNSKVNIYSFELDYYIITKKSFEYIYKEYLDETPVKLSVNTLPKSEINIIKNNEFSIIVSPFNKNQCTGHFDNYPIVPAVYITNCILQQIFVFLENKTISTVDSLEMFLPAAMPIETIFNVSVVHQMFLKGLTHFKCEVKDNSSKTYGFYNITIKQK